MNCWIEPKKCKKFGENSLWIKHSVDLNTRLPIGVAIEASNLTVQKGVFHP
jgi:hypothetical protein